MIVKQLIEVFDILDSADASGLKVKEYLESKGATNVEVVKREKDGKSTDFVKVVIPGSNGRLKGGNAPSLGIIGRLGGIGARPERIGFVSDGDGALTALAAAAKILDMNSKKDFLATFTSAPMYAPMRPPRLTFPCPSWVLPSIWQ